MVTIYRRGKRLYLQYPITPGGKRRQRSTGLDDTPANRRYLRDKIIPDLTRRILNGDLIEATRTQERSFGHYSRLYLRSREHLKTYTELSAQVKRIEARFPGDITDIRRGDVLAYSQELLRHNAPPTVRKYLNILQAILTLAIDYEVITANPAAGVKLPTHHKHQRDPFAPEDVERILSAATGWFRNYLAVAFYTGARPGEILAIRHSDIDLTRRTIRIERNIQHGQITTPKTRYSIRTIPLLDDLLPYLRGQMLSGGPWLFARDDGKHFTGSRTPRHNWNRLMHRLGIQDRDPYTTRHTFITNALRTGEWTIDEIAAIVGHKNTVQIRESYARFIPDQHLRVSRSASPYTDNPADTTKQNAI